ncbi:type 1 glutamine amidotransferase domain-containing protein [Salinimicrobium sediminilitoris]|uniref:type 1 glutamine amidotransferase domain-containing protein n=1 Tax=Salinimicrobium sediminilitoris TaxID=2876715 RepID=UPI001E491ACF|nr:type 1 glutamine amidotransferase domain-containing protein [Salinimicrobium sediminilitoris]MCC8358987.1 type 1 glutamine amidotransferase domain-containing protein [Salinimicrobium sediminilitoris]
MKKILVILTSNSDLLKTDSHTGVWLGEFTDPYYEFIDKGYDVTLASPKGGKPPIDPRSQLTENVTSSNRRFKKDEKAQKDFEFTQKLSEVTADNFDAVFFPGGHGPMGDLATDEDTSRLVIEFYKQNKPIAAVCHGPAALLTAATEEPELLQGREVTAFSNNEEKLVGLRDNIPFSLEDRLKTLGAKYSTATLPFTSRVKVSGKLVTGQNPASAEKTAKELIKLLE